MKNILAKALFIICFPLITFGIICAVLFQELRRAAISIWLELRIEFGSVCNAWRSLK